MSYGSSFSPTAVLEGGELADAGYNPDAHAGGAEKGSEEERGGRRSGRIAGQETRELLVLLMVLTVSRCHLMMMMKIVLRVDDRMSASAIQDVLDKKRRSARRRYVLLLGLMLLASGLHFLFLYIYVFIYFFTNKTIESTLHRIIDGILFQHCCGKTNEGCSHCRDFRLFAPSKLLVHHRHIIRPIELSFRSIIPGHLVT